MAPSRVEEQASQTALSAAMLRYMSTKEADPAFRGPDGLAVLFLPPNVKTVLFFGFLRNLLRGKFAGGMEYVLARTRHFDEQFRQALAADIPQIVLLGAGYDTRATRFEQHIKNTRIFELDSPHTQQYKQTVLERKHVQLPEALSFIPINFRTQKLDEVLSKAGYDPSQRTLFLWEGVTMYLTQDAVKATLQFVAQHSGRGSHIVFDYFLLDAFQGSEKYYGAKETFAAVSRDREPFQFGIEEGKAASFLNDVGLKLIDHCSPQEIEQKYLVDEAGTLYGRMYGFACFAAAGVAG